MNPILPRNYFVPDVEARVMPDGRLYIYGSFDVLNSNVYCSYEYHVFSTDDPTLTNWVDHGVSFTNTVEQPGLPWLPGELLWAPDAIHKDGKYYLYACSAGDGEVVAVSDKPYGPFTDSKRVVGADGDGIDPAIFVDDDGQAYYFWGQFSLRGAKLKDDMCTVDQDSLVYGVLTEQEHGFHEGASIRKINGKYYLVYTDITRGKATCLSYAMSDSPLGPYKRCGVIVDNMYCDPYTWNDHGSICEFKGQWYIFYHRSSQNSNLNRRVCVEPITINADGTINEVCMTSQGPSGPINAFETIDASIACRMRGSLYIKNEHPEADVANEVLVECGGGNFKDAWAEYKYIDFGDGVSSCKFNVRGNGVIELRVDGSDDVIGSVEIDGGEGFNEYTMKITKETKGVHALWVFFKGKGMALDSFCFEK